MRNGVLLSDTAHQGWCVALLSREEHTGYVPLLDRGGVHVSDQDAVDASGVSDGQLIAEARAGGRAAFAELWNRHYAVGVSTARQLNARLDPDDVVSEAFARIYDRVVAGGGPEGPFRPYLYAVIRNLTARWGTRESRELAVEFDDQWDSPIDEDDPAMTALERSLTARAFRALPDRWQTVLWYTEVEGMDPHEVAPLMGLTPNGVAALSYRAREGLRSAWLQAHISDDGVPEACTRVVPLLGEFSRGKLAARESDRVRAHIDDCTRCCILVDELEDVSGRLAMILVPLIVGSSAGGLLAFGGGAPSAAAAMVAPSLPLSIGAPAAVTVSGGLVVSLATTAAVFAVPLLIASAVIVGVAADPATTEPGPPAESGLPAVHSPSAPGMPNPDGGVVSVSVDPGTAMSETTEALDDALIGSLVPPAAGSLIDGEIAVPPMGGGLLTDPLVTDTPLLADPLTPLVPSPSPSPSQPQLIVPLPTLPPIPLLP